MILGALDLLVPFILTFVIKLAILAVFIRKAPIRTALHAFLISALMWPIATVLFKSLPGLLLVALPTNLVQVGAISVSITGLSFLTVIQVGVILAEAALISLLFVVRRRKSLIISVLANFLSFFVLFIYPL